MTENTAMPPRRQLPPKSKIWRDSDILYLLKCYDVWSATPPRGCECGSPLPDQR